MWYWLTYNARAAWPAGGGARAAAAKIQLFPSRHFCVGIHHPACAKPPVVREAKLYDFWALMFVSRVTKFNYRRKSSEQKVERSYFSSEHIRTKGRTFLLYSEHIRTKGRMFLLFFRTDANERSNVPTFVRSDRPFTRNFGTFLRRVITLRANVCLSIWKDSTFTGTSPIITKNV
jgi:hypothetical protein